MCHCTPIGDENECTNCDCRELDGSEKGVVIDDTGECEACQ